MMPEGEFAVSLPNFGPRRIPADLQDLVGIDEEGRRLYLWLCRRRGTQHQAPLPLQRRPHAAAMPPGNRPVVRDPFLPGALL
jgi:hypothetical protein